MRLAFTASYRFGLYEQNDSPQLTGLGDRDDTLLAGFRLVYDGPAGTELSLGYEHDAFNRIGGGEGGFTVSRAFPAGRDLRLTPNLGAFGGAMN